jgi:hypothetical protein
MRAQTEGRCPSDLKLEAHLLDPERAGIGPHLETCPSCRGRLEEMRRQGEEFRRFVYPATVDAVVERSRPRPWWRTWRVLVPVPVLAAAALFLLVVPRRPPDDYLGVKGGVALAVYAATPAGVRLVADGTEVPASAALRFQVRSARPCRLWLVAVDATGTVSRLYPASGDEGAETARAGALPGGAVLDGRAGPERIYAACAPGSLPFSTVERAAREAAGGGEAAVRSAGALRGLPAGTLQETLLLEKRP